MEKKTAWYEAKIIKDMMALMGGRALRGGMSSFISSKIYQGKTSLIRVTNLLEATIDEEDRRALIITDSYTQKFARYITEYLDTIGMEYKIWAGVEPEVPISTISEGAKICEEFKPQVLIAIGGGSVMDTTKMVMVKYEKPEVNIFMILPYFGSIGLRKKFKYFIAIPTTSGTGSEVTQVAVITDTDRNPPKKLEILSDEFCADITILFTDFVKDMPPFLTMATGLDAFSHATGSYVSNWGSPYIDSMNLTAIKEIVKYLPRAYKYGAKDIEAREHMQMASLMAGIGFGNTTPGIDHALGHSLGKIFNIHHGLSVGLFTIYSIAFQAKVTDRWMDLCPIFNIQVENKKREDLLSEFIQAIKDFINALGAPVCVKDMKDPPISKEEYFDKLDLLTDYADDDAVALTSFRTMSKKLFRTIFEYAWDGQDIDF
jgi:alcohol dehydrogenase class IV